MYYKRIFVKYCIKVYNEVIGNYLGVYSMFMEEDFKIISENINKVQLISIIKIMYYLINIY